MTKFDIFVVNLKRSADRREAMKRKIAGIRGFKEIYIDGEKINSSLGAPCGDFENLGRFADAPVQSHAPNSQKTSQLPPQILELDSSKIDLSESDESSLRGRIVDSHEAIQKNQIDCHENPADFLAMTGRESSLQDSSHYTPFSSLRGRIVDSPEAIQTNKSARSANLCKSFCYFWLSPKVESPLPLNPNLLSNVVSTQSAESTLHFHFFHATDATKFKNSESPLPPQYSSKLTRFVKGKDLSFGEIACFSSHYRLWQKCVEVDSPIIVLEDDIDFMQDFCQIIEIFKSPFEYVRLYYLFDRKITHLYDNFYISFGNVSGAQGYYLTPQAAQNFIKNARFWLFCVDDYMDMFFIHSVKNIIFKPFIISEDSLSAGSSTILGREKPKMRFYQKLTRELSRIYFFVIRKYVYFALHCVELRAFFRANKW